MSKRNAAAVNPTARRPPERPRPKRSPRRFYTYRVQTPFEEMYVQTDDEGLITSASAPRVRQAGLVGMPMQALRNHLTMDRSRKVRNEEISVDLI